MRRLVVSLVIAGLTLGGLLLLRITLFRPLLAASTGSITGWVVLVGEAPQPKKIKVTKDNKKCGTEKSAEDLVVSPDRGIKNAVVSLAGIKGKPAKANNKPTLGSEGMRL